MTRILEAVEKNIDLSGVREFTVEAGRPDTITADKLSTLRCGGVSRISINPQTTNNEILHKIGRLHTAEDFLRAYEMADRDWIFLHKYRSYCRAPRRKRGEFRTQL